MSKVLIIGDVHLGGSLSLGRPAIGSQLNSRVIDQINLLEWIFNQALEYNVGTLIFTGDVTDSPEPEHYLTRIFFEFLKKCELYNISVHIVAGNHDLKRTGQFLDSYLDLVEKFEFDDIFVYKDPETIHLDNCSFTFLPYRDKRNLSRDNNSEALEIIKEIIQFQVSEIPLKHTSVLVGHFALQGSLPVGDEIDDFANELILGLDMFNDYDYVWMGHVHKPQVLSKTPYLAHIGSLDISNFGETNQDKILILFDTLTSCFEEIKVPTRCCKKISIEVPLEADATEFVLNELQKYLPLKNTTLKLEIKLENIVGSVNRKTVEEWLNQQEIHYLAAFSESRTLQPIASQVQIIENDLTPYQAIEAWANSYDFGENSELLKKMYLEMASEIIQSVEN